MKLRKERRDGITMGDINFLWGGAGGRSTAAFGVRTLENVSRLIFFFLSAMTLRFSSSFLNTSAAVFTGGISSNILKEVSCGFLQLYFCSPIGPLCALSRNSLFSLF